MISRGAAILVSCTMLLASPSLAHSQTDTTQPPQIDSQTPAILAHHGFREYTLHIKNDWITFYVHASDKTPMRNMVLFLTGSTPDPTFSYEMKDGKQISYYWGHQDYKQLPPDYAYIVIAKRGNEGAFSETALSSRPTPDIYMEKNSLDYRVWQADNVINYCYKHLLKSPQKVIVYGHSEGAPVAAKLGTVNHRITHLGFWCGNGLPDFYEFALMRRKEFWAGKITDAESQKRIDALFDDYRAIFATPNDTQGSNGSKLYTNKRWVSYSEPPVSHLLRIDIPIYVQVSTLDDNAPIETSYIIPIEFTRHRKNNLTYRVGVGWDHGFNEVDSSGKKTSHWDEVFRDFIQWTNTTGKGN